MQTYTYNSIEVGMKRNSSYTLSNAVYEHFMQAFKDINPIHTDDDYARAQEFKSRVAHGAILNGFLSHFVGVEFPGKHALLQSVHIQYKAPTYVEDMLELEAEVTQKVDAVRVIVMNIHIKNKTQAYLSATATVQVGIRA